MQTTPSTTNTHFSSIPISLHQNLPTTPSACRDVDPAHFRNAMFISFLLSNLPQTISHSWQKSHIWSERCRPCTLCRPYQAFNYQQSYHRKGGVTSDITCRPSYINITTQCRLQPRPQAVRVESVHFSNRLFLAWHHQKVFIRVASPIDTSKESL
jgi:hypothetical protein